MKKNIASTKAPAAVGPYSQGIALENLIFTSGQVPLIPGTKDMPETITEQAHQALKNVQAVLEEAGSGLDKAIKLSVFLTDLNNFALVNEVYAQYFQKPFPARSCFQVAALPLGAKIEIEAIAYK